MESDPTPLLRLRGRGVEGCVRIGRLHGKSTFSHEREGRKSFPRGKRKKKPLPSTYNLRERRSFEWREPREDGLRSSKMSVSLGKAGIELRKTAICPSSPQGKSRPEREGKTIRRKKSSIKETNMGERGSQGRLPGKQGREGAKKTMQGKPLSARTKKKRKPKNQRERKRGKCR